MVPRSSTAEDDLWLPSFDGLYRLAPIRPTHGHRILSHTRCAALVPPSAELPQPLQSHHTHQFYHSSSRLADYQAVFSATPTAKVVATLVEGTPGGDVGGSALFIEAVVEAFDALARCRLAGGAQYAYSPLQSKPVRHKVAAVGILAVDYPSHSVFWSATAELTNGFLIFQEGNVLWNRRRGLACSWEGSAQPEWGAASRRHGLPSGGLSAAGRG